jgi:hypothetical protein
MQMDVKPDFKKWNRHFGNVKRGGQKSIKTCPHCEECSSVIDLP